MKKGTYLFILSQFFCIFLSSTNAQQIKQITNVTSYGGEASEIIECNFRLNNGNYIITGFTKSGFLDDSLPTYEKSEEFANGATFIYCLNSIGEKVWHKVVGGSSNDRFYGFLLEEDGFILYGTSSSLDRDLTANKGEGDAWIIKFTNNGDLLWSKSIGSEGDDYYLNIKKFDGNSYLSILSVGDLTDDFANITGLGIGDNLVKLDTAFNIIDVVKHIPSSDSLWATAHYITEDFNVIGCFMNVGSQSHYGHSYVEKYDAKGIKVFDYTFKEDIMPFDSLYTCNYSISGVLSENDTTYLVIEKNVFDNNSADFFYKGTVVIVGLTPQGNEFARYQSPIFSSVLNNTIQKNGDQLIVAGSYLNYSDSSWSIMNYKSKGYVIFLDKNLQEKYHYSLIGNGDNTINGIYFNETNSSYQAISQSSSSDLLSGMNVKGELDVVWIKFDAFPTQIINATASSLNFNLFPNPNEGVFEISTLNQNEVPQYVVWDINGRRLYEGTGFSIQLPTLSAGMYILQVTQSDKSGYKRFQVK